MRSFLELNDTYRPHKNGVKGEVLISWMHVYCFDKNNKEIHATAHTSCIYMLVYILDNKTCRSTHEPRGLVVLIKYACSKSQVHEVGHPRTCLT